jgi:hypothetical protein
VALSVQKKKNQHTISFQQIIHTNLHFRRLMLLESLKQINLPWSKGKISFIQTGPK